MGGGEQWAPVLQLVMRDKPWVIWFWGAGFAPREEKRVLWYDNPS